jgi:hypothetical protein
MKKKFLFRLFDAQVLLSVTIYKIIIRYNNHIIFINMIRNILLFLIN